MRKETLKSGLAPLVLLWLAVHAVLLALILSLKFLSAKEGRQGCHEAAVVESAQHHGQEQQSEAARSARDHRGESRQGAFA